MRISRLFAILLLAVLAIAQEQQPVGPAVYRKAPQRTAEPADPPSRRRLLRSAPASMSLRSLESHELSDLKAIPGSRNLGVHRSLAETGIRYSGRAMRIDGAWSAAADGTRVWRLTVQSEGAEGVRIHFTGFSIGKGRVWVHGGDASTPAKPPFTGRGPWGDGDFWTHVVFSNTVHVEYEPAEGTDDGEEVPFEIREISHLWSSAQEPVSQGLEKRSASAEASPLMLDNLRGVLGIEKVESEPTAPQAAAACQLDVSCYPDWSDTSRSVALIIFESDGGTFSCSGTLLNTRNNSFTPYFLTAAHCVENATSARTVEAFWFYGTSSCNGVAPSRQQATSVLGARQARRFGDFNDPRGDFNLLVLEDVPDGVVFAGWDPDPVAFGTRVAGIHHPEGDYKRISFGEAVPDTVYGVSSAYLIVREDDGRTESGSSGSGLFTAPNVLTGALSFGPSLPRGTTVCDINPSYVGYGRFSALYPEISDYLEDVLPPPDGADGLLESGVPQEFSLPAVFQATLFSDPVYRIEVPANSASLTIDLLTLTASVDLDLYVRHGAPPEVQGGSVVADFRSETPSGTEQVVIGPELREGTYFIAFALWTRRMPVEARLTATLEAATGNGEPPRLGAVVHGATQTPGPIAPGEIVAIYGTNLGPDTGVEARLTESGRLPTLVEGAQVFFNDIPAPLFFVRRDQINAQAPYEIASSASVQVRVVYEGLVSEALAVDVSPSAPGIFMFLDGGNRAIVLNQDGTLNSAATPESRGAIVVFFATGEGLRTPNSLTGTAAGDQLPLPIPELPVAVEIGGIQAEVLFAGAAPGYVGLLQVNARIPVNTAVGQAVPIVLRVGENASSDNVTMSIQ